MALHAMLKHGLVQHGYLAGWDDEHDLVAGDVSNRVERQAELALQLATHKELRAVNACDLAN